MRREEMIMGRKKIQAGCLLVLMAGVFACGPVHDNVRPDASALGNVTKLAIVIPPEGDFTVLYERAKGTATAAVLFGLAGAAIAGSHNKSMDEDLAKSIRNVNQFSCGPIFRDSLKKSLMDSGRFSDVAFFDKDIEPGDASKYDAVLTLQIPRWGVRIVERGQTELVAAFVDVEAKMIKSSTSRVIWDEHDTVIGQSKRALSSYQFEKDLCSKDIQETADDAGQKTANIIIYR
jgi:hypothetical protein